MNNLNGGTVETLSAFISDKLHKYCGVDPATGKIVGTIAGNVLFHLSGKDNKLGKIGKVILDNIVTGKSRRKVRKFVHLDCLQDKRRMVFFQVDPYVPSGSNWGAQVFSDLRQECLRNKTLFEDPYFPATDKSLFYSQSPPKPVQWMRPGVSSSLGASSCCDRLILKRQ